MAQDASVGGEKIKRIVHVQPHVKVMVSLVVSFLWLVVTRGTPPNTSLLQGVSHVNTEVQQIFETTLMVQRKRFIKRIVQQSQGYWRYVPYANQPRWIDLQITLTTRIGFNMLSGDAHFDQNGNLMINVLEPTILNKHWQTSILDKADNAFNKWDIRDYKLKENAVIEALAEAQSQNMLEIFRNDPGKMGQLSYNLEQRLKGQQDYLGTPLQWIDRLNRMVDGKIRDIKYAITASPQTININHTYQHRKIPLQSSKKAEVGHRKAQNQVARSGRKKVYTLQEQRMRKQMKNQLDI